MSWRKGLRRMRVRYDRLGAIIDAWTTLAASVICFRVLELDRVETSPDTPELRVSTSAEEPESPCCASLKISS